jgi:hypothetical protein
MIIKGSCRDFGIIEKSSRDPSMFSSNIVRGLQLKHTWSLAFYGRRFLNFIIYLWTCDSPELVKCGIWYNIISLIWSLFKALLVIMLIPNLDKNSYILSKIPQSKSMHLIKFLNTK